MVYIAYSNRDLRSVMRTAHSHVKGVDSSGARYHSLNPELFFFQHATYVDALFTSIDIFHSGLDGAAKEQLYQECCRWYAKYDISDRAQPATYREFVDYERLRRETLHPPTWYPRKVPPAAIRAMLHPRAAELLGVDVGAGDRLALRAFAARTNMLTTLSPARYHLIPSARHDPDN